MDIKSKITEMFFENPEKQFHVREIARALKKSPTTVSSILKELEKKKILTSEKKYNHLFFKASSGSEFKQAKLSYNLDLIQNSGLIDYLAEEYAPEAIILFGSFAKAENTKKSDIDILIVTPRKKQVDLEKFEKSLDHEIQLFVHSKKEIEQMKEKNKELLNNWVNGIKLCGFLELFK